MSSTKLQTEKARIRDYMMLYCCGYKKARPHRDITFALRMEDRYFRDLCAEIPEIITSSKFGYWILPLVDPTGEETRFALDILKNQDRRRIIALYLRNKRQRQAVARMAAKEVQREFAM